MEICLNTQTLNTRCLLCVFCVLMHSQKRHDAVGGSHRYRTERSCVADGLESDGGLLLKSRCHFVDSPTGNPRPALAV